MANKDALQKDMLCQHFAAQGWYVQPEVIVFYKEGIHERKKIITDIDVMALRPTVDLRWELVLGDCKTLKGQSPANRAIWLRGLMEYFSASAGTVLLRRKQSIEVDHKYFAASLGVTLLEESEFEYYDRAIIYPNGSDGHLLRLRDLLGLRTISNRYPRLKVISEYIYELAWNEEKRLDLLRKVIGEAQHVAQEIDPNKPEHLALVLDVAGVFAIGLAECAGSIFKQYLIPKTLEQLDDALKLVIWGGSSQYNFIAKLRYELIVAKGRAPRPGDPLALPVWKQFIQLVRNILENPQLAFFVPQLLQRAAINVYYNQPFLPQTRYDDLLLLKYAMLTINYLCRAASFPPDTIKKIESMFIRKQSELVHSSKSEEEEKQEPEEVAYQKPEEAILEESQTEKTE